MNQVRIPDKFSLFAQVFDVVKRADLDQKTGGNLGEIRMRNSLIELQDTVEGCPISRQLLEKVYIHEIIHTILFMLGEDDLSQNETFVELFAASLHQILASSEGGEYIK